MTPVSVPVSVADEAAAPPLVVRRRGVLFPRLYVIFIFVALLDALFTSIILYRGGREVNTLANAVLARFGIAGMVIFKFLLVAFVIGLCELIGRGRRRRAMGWARFLAVAGVLITAFPVTVAVSQLYHARGQAAHSPDDWTSVAQQNAISDQND